MKQQLLDFTSIKNQQNVRSELWSNLADWFCNLDFLVAKLEFISLQNKTPIRKLNNNYPFNIRLRNKPLNKYIYIELRHLQKIITANLRKSRKCKYL